MSGHASGAALAFIIAMYAGVMAVASAALAPTPRAPAGAVAMHPAPPR